MLNLRNKTNKGKKESVCVCSRETKKQTLNFREDVGEGMGEKMGEKKGFIKEVNFLFGFLLLSLLTQTWFASAVITFEVVFTYLTNGPCFGWVPVNVHGI